MNDKSRTLLLLGFIFGVVGIGLLIGTVTAPGEWYRSLNKPSFNPPNWVFGPVWTVLYLLIAVVGWRVWKADQSLALKVLWGAQMVLNFLWSPVFFGLQNPGAALAVIVALLVVIIAFILKAWSRDRWAALMFLPYLLWVGFATLLNLMIARLN